MGADLTPGPPGIAVDHSTAWVHVAADDDVASWAPAAARRTWAVRGTEPAGPLDVEVLAAEFALLARAALAVPCRGAFVFCPEPSRGPRAVLRLAWLPCPGGDARLAREILLPAERQLLPPQVEYATGGGLRRFRVRQRAWSAGSGTVADHVAYVFPGEDGAWTLTASLPDPLEAERRLADLDELAAGVRLDACR